MFTFVERVAEFNLLSTVRTSSVVEADPSLQVPFPCWSYLQVYTKTSVPVLLSITPRYVNSYPSAVVLSQLAYADTPLFLVIVLDSKADALMVKDNMTKKTTTIPIFFIF